MSSRRVLKAAQAIREVVSMAILTDLKDPRVSNVTVTFVEVSGDLRLAKVHVSVMHEDEGKKRLCLTGLRNATGYLQQKVGKRVDTKYTPRLQFVMDEGVKNSMLVAKILDEVLPKEQNDSDSSDADPESTEQTEETNSPSETPKEANPSPAEENPAGPMDS